MKNINADIGLIGLGVMGSSLALNMESNGYIVAVHNRTAPQIDNIVNNRSPQIHSHIPKIASDPGKSTRDLTADHGRFPA